MKVQTALDETARQAFQAEAKVGLIATINPEGLPHLSMISSIRAKDSGRLMWGQFSEGLSKVNVRGNPHTAWLVLTMDKRLWRGKAVWTHAVQEGEDYVEYNNTPMFRYNSYFGINTVHYMDVKETYGEEKLPMAGIVTASILTRIAGGGADGEKVLIPWAQGLFNDMGALKFISWVGEDGFPVIVPLIQAAAPDSRTVSFSPAAYKSELKGLAPGHQGPRSLPSA